MRRAMRWGLGQPDLGRPDLDRDAAGSAATSSRCAGAALPRGKGLRAAGLAALLAASGAAACSPVVRTHGYAPSPAQLDAIVIGQDGPAAVAAKIGRPGTGGVIRDNDWYYVGSLTETMAFYAPEVVERRVVAVHYDDAGVVSDIKTYGLQDGRIIDLATRTTPTFGRELTVLQQVFGNLSNVGAVVTEDLAR